jgi:arylsulfatase A-like enzyme
MILLSALSCTITPELPAERDPDQLKRLGLHLQVGAMEESGVVGIRVVGAPTNGRIKVFSGSNVGTGPCWAYLQGGCFGIKKPIEIASLVADASGSVRVDVNVVPPLGTIVPLQAVADGSPPTLSNVVVRTVVASGSAPPPLGPNVLIVLLDDVGIDKIAGYGAVSPAITPTIDSLAATGITFEHTYARPVCSPGRASLLTGRHGRRTGIAINFHEDQPWELGTEQITLPELVDLSPYYQYQTSFAGKWHLATEVSPSGLAHPLVQGWDWYSGPFANLYTLATGYLSYFQWRKVVDGAVVDTTTYATTDTFDDAIARVGVMTEPWMLMVSTNAAHAPMEAPPVELTPTLPAAGDGYTSRLMIGAVDTELARLLAAIPADVLARTAIVVTADNGTYKPAVQEWVEPKRAKGTLFDGGVRVPMIISGAGVGAPGTRSAAMVDLNDLFPTVAGWVGVDLAAIPSVLDDDAPYAIDGLDLAPLLADPAASWGRQYAYSEIAGPPGPGPYTEVDRQMIKDHQYKLIVDNNLGKVMFFEYVNGSLDEGPDLLPCGLTTEQAAAYERLTLELAGITAGLVYDADPFLPEIVDTSGSSFPIPDDTGVSVCPP